MSDISLTSGMRTNLVSLQNTQVLLNRTQERLSTGKKVNSALDNPTNYFAAQALNNRANDLASYKDGMSNAIQTIQAANQGITNITTLLNSAKALAASAASLGSSSSTGSRYTTDKISLSGVVSGDKITIGSTTLTAGTDFAVGATDAQTATNLAAKISTTAGVTLFNVDSVTGNTITLSKGAGAGTATTDIQSSDINGSGSFGISQVAATNTASPYNTEVLSLSGVKSGDKITIGSTTLTAGTDFAVGATDSQTAINLATKIGSTAGVTQFTVNSVSGTNITLSKSAAGGAATTDIQTGDIKTGSSISGTVVASGATSSTQLSSLVSQYSSILSQIDSMASDSSFQGVNLLSTASSTALVVSFGNGHSLSIQGYDATSTGLGLSTAQNGWTSQTSISSDVTKINNALSTLQSESSAMSNNLSIIQTRQDFSTKLGNVLTTGADNLTLADTNEEGANMLMLQTRLQLGTTALSMSAQAAQSVMKLF